MSTSIATLAADKAVFPWTMGVETMIGPLAAFRFVVNAALWIVPFTDHSPVLKRVGGKTIEGVEKQSDDEFHPVQI